MSARYSNPSQGIGVNRFRVWPVKTTDSYNTVELAANFDKIDAMFGVPAAATAWPSVEGVDGGVYREVKLLQNDRTPIGTVIAWWRPSVGVAIPTGWVELKGQTLIAAQHDFAGGGTIVLPEGRNRFILGADSATTAGQAAAAVGAGNIDSSGGAPGLGYMGGSNQNTLDLTHLPPHNHGGGDHGHSVSDPGHIHGVADPGHNHGGFTGYSNQQVLQRDFLGTVATAFVASNPDRFIEQHTHSIPVGTTGIGIYTASTGITLGNSGAIISTQGGGLPHDNRPAYVSLIWLMKVKYSTTP